VLKDILNFPTLSASRKILPQTPGVLGGYGEFVTFHWGIMVLRRFAPPRLLELRRGSLLLPQLRGADCKL
jgi:hypothetical protein